MYPILIKLGLLRITSYGVFFALGFFLSVFALSKIGNKKGWSYNFCSDLGIWIIISSIIGARLSYVISEWDNFVRDISGIFKIYQGGLIYYGGVAGGMIGISLFALRRNIKIIPLYDAVATVLPLGHALGRVGCFLNGCCWGKVTYSFIGIKYPKYSFAYEQQLQNGLITIENSHSLPVHPVQLYEAVSNIVLFILLQYIYRKNTREGFTAGIYMISYGFIRFCIEFLRGDTREILFAKINVAQGLSIILALIGIYFIIRSFLKNNESVKTQT